VRTQYQTRLESPEVFKIQLLNWAQQFREITYLDSNNYQQTYSSFDAILAVDAFTSVKTDADNAFEGLRQYQQTTKDWLFGYMSYDLKNDIEDLKSDNHDGLNFPDLYFFQPKKLFFIIGDKLEMHYLKMCDDEMELDLDEIKSFSPDYIVANSEARIEQRISQQEYLHKVGVMLEHIQRGDIYEANFCMEFFAENTLIDPVSVFHRLNGISEPPFAAYFKHHKHFAISASPERYIRKSGRKIISQPIKGTARRSDNPDEDSAIQNALRRNQKERSENIMIVDLVRNDLSKTAAKGSVQVEELCGAYAFRQVHHLVSTVVSELASDYTAIDVLKTTFPMGSMTGAPKISAMKIIEQLEETKRGLYSGAAGYFTPDGDFDFNVVIRSILYNSVNRYVSFSVGSAITSESTAESEYEECLLKAKAMLQVLG
jgi:para-aminobenzoate synthetase component 1